jgi:hypothetical protein
MMIQNTEELREYVLKLAADNENNPRTIVEYMLALLKRLEQASNIVVPTFQDIADLLRDAYTGDQAEYSKDWEKLPKYTTEMNSDAYHKEIRSHEWQVRNLKLHIVELEKMRLRGQLDPKRIANPQYSVKMFKDFYWMNFTAKDYMGAYAEHLSIYEPGDWLMLSDLIEEGPGYQDDLYG